MPHVDLPRPLMVGGRDLWSRCSSCGHFDDSRHGAHYAWCPEMVVGERCEYSLVERHAERPPAVVWVGDIPVCADCAERLGFNLDARRELAALHTAKLDALVACPALPAERQGDR